MPPAQFDRVILLDPGLGPFPGHWAGHARTLRDAFAALGLRTLICGNTEQKAGLLDGLEVRPTFRLTPYVPFSADPHDPRTARPAFEEQMAAFADDFAAVDAGERDLLVLAAVYPHILGGFAAWARERAAALMLLFGEEVSVFNRGRGENGDSYYLDYYQRVLPPSRGARDCPNWRFFAASPALGDLFSVLLGKSVRPLPMPGRADWPPLAARGARPLTIAVLGHGAIAKGSLLLPEIIAATHARRPEVRFVLHLSPNPDTRAAFDAMEPGPRVDIVRGHVSDADMQRMTDAADIVLMPYQPEKYRLMPSAIFVQAICSGKVLVIPANTHMHREILLRGGGATCFREQTAAAVTAALLDAIERYESLSRRSLGAAAEHRRLNNPAAYASEILAAFA